MAIAALRKNDRAAQTKFNWPLCYKAENFIFERIDAFLERSNFARVLAKRIRDETGTLILDWTDHLLLSASDEKALREVGYVDDPLGETKDRYTALWHPEAMLPRVLIAASNVKFPLALAVRADLVADFAIAHGIYNKIEGEPFSRFRKLLVGEENGAQLFVVERRGYRGYIANEPNLKSYCAVRELFQRRRRTWDDDPKGFAYVHKCLKGAVDLVGRDLACHLFFREERAYWEKRNRAGQKQRHRQDALGLGWANHDHHTFRSSRECFVDLMKAFEMMGFERRERYYAGAEAGWGAQILEQPFEGIVVFADVDLTPDETEIDFSRVKLTPEKSLGTVQLWCGLHGESLFEAGMHHLECRFDHALLRRTVGQGRYQHDGTVLGFFVFETSIHRRRTLASPARALGKIAGAEINHRRTISRICQQRRDWQSPGKFAAEGRLQRIQPARGQSDHQRDRSQKTEELRRSLATSLQCGRDFTVLIIWESL